MVSTTALKPKTTTKKTTTDDVIISVAQTVENLTIDKAAKYAFDCMNDSEVNRFKIGGLLAVASTNGWHTEAGYPKFTDYMDKVLGVPVRSGMYWMAIYTSLVESGVKWEQVAHLGWTKVKEIAPLINLENVDEWVGIAKEKTLIQLVDYIKGYKSQKAKPMDEAAEETDGEVKTLTTITFKVYEDQKAVIKEALEVSKEQVDTTFDAVAIEHICLDFISKGGAATKPMSLKAVVEKYGAEEVLTMVGELFPDLAITVAM